MLKTSRPVNGTDPARIGSIVIGDRVKMGANFRPVKIEHFKIVKGRESSGENKGGQWVDEEAMEAVGGKDSKPTELNILLPFKESDRNFQTERAMYSKVADGPTVKQCCCVDGNTAKWRKNRTDYEDQPCDGDRCKYALSGACKMLGTLNVILADVGNVGGVYKFRTTSWRTIRNINASLNLLEGIVRGVDENASLAFVPLVLHVYPDLLQTPKTGAQTFYTCVVMFKGEKLDFEKSVAKLICDSEIARNFAQGNVQKALMAAADDETETFVQEEYYPDVETVMYDDDYEAKEETTDEPETVQPPDDPDDGDDYEENRYDGQGDDDDGQGSLL